MYIGVRRGWLWSALLGAVIGYSARGSGIKSPTVIAWAVLAVAIAGARFLRFAVEEPEWWAVQVRMKGAGTVAWNTIRALVSFAVIYAAIMAGAGLFAFVL